MPFVPKCPCEVIPSPIGRLPSIARLRPFLYALLFASMSAGTEGLIRTSSAVVPPYAEEWPVPEPQDVEVDPFGRVWVSSQDDSVRVYEPTGGVLLFAFGGSGTGDGEFQTPYGIGFQPNGDAYVCDYAGARIEKFASDGTFLLSWPVPSDRADHVAVDAFGDVYVSGYSDLSVHKYTSDGAPIADWPSAGGTYTSGIVVTDETIHVVQWDLPVVEQFATDGTYLGSFDDQTLNGTDIEVDASGQLWVVDYSGNVVRVFQTDGTPLDVLGVAGAGPGEFDGPSGVAVGPDGSIYVADEANGRIQRFGAAPSDVPGGQAGDIGPRATLRVTPNPCRDRTQLEWVLPSADHARLTVVDVRGVAIGTIADGPMRSGSNRIGWDARRDDGRPVAAGVYWIRLATGGGEVATARLLVVR